MAKVDRNPLPLPQIKEEEYWTEPLSIPGYDYDWKQFVGTYDRLYLNHTLGSIRKDVRLKAPRVPRDSLDFRMSSVYQAEFQFQEKSDIVRLAETVGLPSWRQLRNTRYIPEPVIATATFKHEPDETRMSFSSQKESVEPGQLERRKAPGEGRYGHPMIFGGIPERLHTNQVKVGISSNHGSQTNAGFCRKIDGTNYTS